MVAAEIMAGANPSMAAAAAASMGNASPWWECVTGYHFAALQRAGATN
jgi:hypothetical protein